MRVGSSSAMAGDRGVAVKTAPPGRVRSGRGAKKGAAPAEEPRGGDLLDVLSRRRRSAGAGAERIPLDGEVAVALIGGQRLLREAAAQLLDGERTLNVVGSHASAREYLDSRHSPAPQVLLVDCDDEQADWEATLTDLGDRLDSARLVLLCAQPRPEIIRCAVEHHAGGVLLRQYTSDQIRDALAYIATGRTIMPLGWQGSLGAAPPLGPSPRQLQILDLISKGRCNAEIAEELGLSTNTVKFHVRELYTRIGAHNRVEAAIEYAHMTRGGD